MHHNFRDTNSPSYLGLPAHILRERNLLNIGNFVDNRYPFSIVQAKLCYLYSLSIIVKDDQRTDTIFFSKYLRRKLFLLYIAILN